MDVETERATRAEASRSHPSPQWLVTAAFGAFSSRPGEPARSATSVANAMQMGARFAACDVFADTWHKEWAYAFLHHPGAGCTKCIHVAGG